MTNGLLARPPEEGARLIALSYLDEAAAARIRLKGETDAEALHDFRVALRRLRSCLRAYRDPLKGSVPKKLAKRLKRLAGATGPGRDAEVQLEWLRARGSRLGSQQRQGLAWMLARLNGRMREAYGDLQAEIERDFPEVDGDLRRHLSVYKTMVFLDPESPPPTLGVVTAQILRDQVAELAANLAQVRHADDVEEAHRSRISAKRARYLLEPFAEELPENAPIVKRFKALQDLLGDLHDSHVLEEELTGAVEEAAAERARRLLELSLTEAPDSARLRAERRRSRETGLIALARQNRDRRDHLFAILEAEWLNGAAAGFLHEVAALEERLAGDPMAEDQYAPPSV
ncbi:MAG TPA: CHAD domain-containing protein [Thermoanaerobaculia bacterium]|jgi:CHAD domain-containing protein|nr:CHAD domain-containing protein [Thermoanaerobaculia bacterium]